MFDSNTIDRDALNLTRAIGLQEGGGKIDYNAVGDAGTSKGAYQWQPGNFESAARDAGLDPNDFSPENQDKVAYARVKSRKDAGLQPWEIAAEWNSGSKDNWKDHSGDTTINGQTIHYDTPAYVSNVKNYYTKLAGGTSTNPAADIAGTNIQTPPTTLEAPGILSQSINQFGKGYGQISKGVDEGNLGDIGKGVLNEAAGGIRAVFSPVEWATKMVAKIPGISNVVGGVEKGINYVADKISNNPQLQDFMVKHPDADEVAGNLITIGATLVGGKESPEIRDSLNPITEKVSDVVKPIKEKLQQKAVNSTIEDWNRIGGDYVKTDKLLSKEEALKSNPNSPESVQDTPTFLSNLGISPKALIRDNKFDTSIVADKLSGDAIKPFEDVLTEQLKVAQQSQPPVSVGEIHSQIIKNINDIKNITEGDRETMIAASTREMRLLNKKYPDGIPLDKLNEVKGNYWRATKFDVSNPLRSQVNYNIGSTMKDVIEQKSGDANVAELNGLLGNYYKSAKFLRGLDGKIPKLTGKQKIVRGVVKGAAVLGGEKLFGIGGGVGGFLLSKSIAQMLESSSGGLQTRILDTLEKTNPKAYTEAIKWLGSKEHERLSRLMLPEAGESLAPEGKKGSPIPRVINIKATNKTTYEPAAQKIRRQPIPEDLRLNAPGQNPIQLPGSTSL